MIADDIIVQPGLLIVCGEITKKFLDFPPALVVEILSPSTALKDRHTKYALYQSQQIAYYIIVDPDTREVEIFQLKDRSYSLQQKGGDFAYQFSLNECSLMVNFADIW